MSKLSGRIIGVARGHVRGALVCLAALSLSTWMQGAALADTAPAMEGKSETPPPREIICSDDLGLSYGQANGELQGHPGDRALELFVAMVQEQRGFVMEARSSYFRIIDSNSEEAVTINCGRFKYDGNAVADIAQDRLFDLDTQLRLLGVSEEQLAIGEAMTPVEGGQPSTMGAQGPTGWVAHLATYSTEQGAKSTLREIARRFGREVGAREFFFTPVLLDESGMMFRIGVQGFADRAGVVRFCAGFLAKGQTCAPLVL